MAFEFHPAATFLALVLGEALHLDGQQLAGGSHGIIATTFSSSLAVRDGLALQGRGASVEDEYWADAEPKQLAYATEEADNVGIAEGVAFLVSYGFQELVDPDRGIDGETFAVQGSKVGRSRAWLNDGPEAIHTHDDDEMATGASSGCDVKAGYSKAYLCERKNWFKCYSNY